MAAVLDAMGAKRLIANDLVRDGEVCALGALGVARGINMDGIDPEDRETVADVFGIAPALAAEIAYVNDEQLGHHISTTPEDRFLAMRQWVASKIKRDEPS
jgi:hypothetical protein